ncbi:MAG: hypothetical protein ACLVJH_17675 [Faecalibacterium prausnitzii]
MALALKSEDESWCHADLISVDLYTGTARLFKTRCGTGLPLKTWRQKGGDTSCLRYSGDEHRAKASTVR